MSRSGKGEGDIGTYSTNKWAMGRVEGMYSIVCSTEFYYLGSTLCSVSVQSFWMQCYGSIFFGPYKQCRCTRLVRAVLSVHGWCFQCRYISNLLHVSLRSVAWDKWIELSSNCWQIRVAADTCNQVKDRAYILVSLLLLDRPSVKLDLTQSSTPHNKTQPLIWMNSSPPAILYLLYPCQFIPRFPETTKYISHLY